MVLCILKSLLVWGVLAFLAINLTGLILRGLLWSPPTFDDAPTERVADLIGREVGRMRRANVAGTVIPLILAAGMVYGAYHFWNAGLAAAAALAMVACVPQHLWTIRTGIKPTRHDQSVALRIGDVLFILSLPLTWYSLCMWP
jgi:hypothetical protein